MLWKCPKFGGQNHQNLRFLEFLKKWKMANFKLKNLCDETSKIKILRWQFSCIFRWLRRAILHFFCRRCYHGEIWRSKSPVLEIFKKVEKWEILYNKIGPLEIIVFAFIPTHLLGLSKRYVLDPQTLIRDSVFIEIWSKQNRPFFTIFIKNINFFTDQDMTGAIAQNCAKTKGPTKKIDKVNFEVHGTRSVFHLSTLIGVLRKCPQFGGQVRQNLHFFKFSKKRKMAYFKSKNLCDESMNINNLNWQFSYIFRWLRHGILHFFWGAIFMEKF